MAPTYNAFFVFFQIKIVSYIPIVHRAIEVHEKDNGDVKFLTKRDNEEVDYRGLYQEGQNWPEQKSVAGRAGGFSPYVGRVTVKTQDDPKFKHAVLAVVGAYVLLFMNPKMKNNSWDQTEASSVEKESNLFKTFHFPWKRKQCGDVFALFE